MSKKTKIIATFGPSCSKQSVLQKMIQKGVNLVRINASHEKDPKKINSYVKLIQKAAESENRKELGIFVDLQGPKIRIGQFKDNKIQLKQNQVFKICCDDREGNETEVSVSYKSLYKDVKPNDFLYIDDGKVRLEVLKVSGKEISCKVIKEGIISNFKGVNIPTTKINMPALTEKDINDVLTCVKFDIDYLALSFVSDAADIQQLRELLDNNNGSHIKIIAKIERQIAINNLEEIIDAADVIMVARGDLGVEIGVENVPKVQKRIIRESLKRITPVIVATQMLESMITTSIATRAEVSDVANAIYDRCDAVMLSGETAVGDNPVNTIETMSRICIATDDHMIDIKREDDPLKDYFVTKSVATSFCKAADQIAEENNAKAIMAFTSSGNTPLVASRLNSIYPIIAPTDQINVYRRMSFYRGVIPIMMPVLFKSIIRWTDMIYIAVREAKKLKLIEKDDVLIVTAGRPLGVSHGINSIRLVNVK